MTKFKENESSLIKITIRKFEIIDNFRMNRLSRKLMKNIHNQYSYYVADFSFQFQNSTFLCK